MHGGLRYLEMFDFALVKEALEERGLLLTRLAPHLVRPVPFLYPLHHAYERPYVGAGLVLYDAMAVIGARAGKFGNTGVPKHKHLFRKQVARIAPDLKIEGLHGAIRYYDCQVDDARLVMTIARTAASHGAQVATRTQVVGFLREGERVVGVRARDLETDRELEIRARVVVNAAGVWTDDIQDMVGGRGSLNVQASKGIHLVVPRDRIRSECRLHHQDRRRRCCSSSRGAGTGSSAPPTPRGTSTRRTPPPARPTSTTCSATSTRSCASRSTTTTSRASTPACGRWRVASPSPPAGSPASTPSSRRCPGLVMIAGGKLTTYRVMARDAVDAAAALADHAPVTPWSATRSPTGSRWSGRPGFEARTNQRALLARRVDLHISRIDHLLERYGSLVDEVLDADRSSAPSWGCRSRAPTTTSPWRSCTPSPTRAPGTSTTCSPGAPGSRSRPSTAASSGRPGRRA